MCQAGFDAHKLGTYCTYSHTYCSLRKLEPYSTDQVATPSLPHINIQRAMAHFSVVLAAIVGVSYVVLAVLDRIVTNHRIAKKARELGCQDPPHEQFRLPFGIDNVQSAMAADREQLFLDWVTSRAKKIGAYTWTYKLMGKKIIATHEPANIQAILANQFGTFDLGPMRRDVVCCTRACLACSWPFPATSTRSKDKYICTLRKCC